MKDKNDGRESKYPLTEWTIKGYYAVRLWLPHFTTPEQEIRAYRLFGGFL